MEPVQYNEMAKNTGGSFEQVGAEVFDLLPRIGKYKGNDHEEFKYLKEMLTRQLLNLNKVHVDGDEAKKLASWELARVIKSLIAYLKIKESEHSKQSKNKVRRIKFNQVEPKQNQKDVKDKEEISPSQEAKKTIYLKRNWFYRLIKTLFDFF